MRIAIANKVGKVGKTMIGGNLLSPRMENSPIFAVETHNETASALGIDIEQKFKGDDFRKLFTELSKVQAAIIDFGASNIEDAMKKMLSMGEEIHEEIDYFLVPVTPGATEQRETIVFVKSLANMGIAPEKIKIVFNKVKEDVHEEFPAIFGFAKMEKLCIVNADATIFDNEVYDLLSNKKTNVSAVLADDTDYKALLRSNDEKITEKQRNHYADMYTLRSMAKGAHRNLETVFNALFE